MTNLTRKILKQLISYKPETGVFLRRHYSSAPSDDMKDKVDSKGRVFIHLNGDYHSARKLAWLYMTGSLPTGGRVYSINGEYGDHRWINLTTVAAEAHRVVSVPGKRNKSGCVGVVYSKSKDAWVATIRRGGVTEYLTTSKSKGKAVAARRAAERSENVTAAIMFF